MSLRVCECICESGNERVCVEAIERVNVSVRVSECVRKITRV